MSPSLLMHLKVLLPSRIFLEKAEVSRVIAETRDGSFGLLPNRLDCVAALVPSVLVYQREGEDEVCVAVDEGILIKYGTNVTISVRNAIAGMSLDELHDAIDQEFLQFDEGEKEVRRAMEKMETAFIGSMARYHHE